MENLKLWNAVKETDPNKTKKVTFSGRTFTTINATYQMKQATEQFGTYGAGWGIASIEHDFKEFESGHIMVIGKAVFFYTHDSKRVEFPITSSIMLRDYVTSRKYWSIDDDFAKKLETDITTKALSKLGFSADVFEGRYDDNRYLNEIKQKYNKPKQEQKQQPKPQHKPEPKPQQQQKPSLKMATKKDIELLIHLADNFQFKRVEDGLKYWQKDGRGITDNYINLVVEAINRNKELQQRQSFEIFDNLPRATKKDIVIDTYKEEKKQEPPQKIKSFDDIVNNSSPDLNELVNMFNQ